jgi:hypothetical protein
LLNVLKANRHNLVGHGEFFKHGNNLKTTAGEHEERVGILVVFKRLHTFQGFGPGAAVRLQLGNASDRGSRDLRASQTRIGCIISIRPSIRFSLIEGC